MKMKLFVMTVLVKNVNYLSEPHVIVVESKQRWTSMPSGTFVYARVQCLYEVHGLLSVVICMHNTHWLKPVNSFFPFFFFL